MSDIPADLKYIASHEWVRVEGDGTVTVGVTDHAQDALGDVVYVELPEIDVVLSAGDEAGVVESVKAASDIYTPLSGTVIAVNSTLEDAPEQVNSDPYGEGWFFKLRLADAGELDELLDADGYADVCDADAYVLAPAPGRGFPRALP
jgi:glycine cleavage system H protein